MILIQPEIFISPATHERAKHQSVVPTTTPLHQRLVDLLQLEFVLWFQ